MRKLLLILSLIVLNYGLSQAQTISNLQILWQKASPDTGGGCRYWGYRMAGGDLNGDGYFDFVSATDTVIDISGWIKSRIYIFLGGATLSTVPSQVITYDTTGDHQKICIADFNNDGYGDLALGDAYGTGVNETKGCVNIHYGTGVDLNTSPDLVIGGYNGIASTSFGGALSAGDINGDGIDDLVVGAPGYIISGDRKGRVYIYYGDTLGLHTWPDIILNGHPSPINYERFGHSVDATCDINNDGYNDIITCGYLNSELANGGGKVYYYLSNSAPIDTIADGWIYGEGYQQSIGAFGLSWVSVDTAGFSPVGWFGTPIWNNPGGGFGRGKCYMAPGDTIGEITPLWTITGNDLSDSALGYWSCSAGYADNDKLGDVISSALVAFGDPGRVNLWLRRPIMRQQPDAYIIGRASTPGGDALGGKIAPAGDVDSCGRDEFLISNYFADTDNTIWLCKYTGPDGVVGRPVDSDKVYSLNLGQNYPNPFKTKTTITYQLTTNGSVNLSVYNVAGQLVKTLINDPSPNALGEGRVRSITWNGQDESGRAVANGVYIYKLNAGGQSQAKKMIMIR